MDTVALAILAMLLGVLLVLGGGSSFACNSGAIVFCYGLAALIYVGGKKLF